MSVLANNGTYLGNRKKPIFTFTTDQQIPSTINPGFAGGWDAYLIDFGDGYKNTTDQYGRCSHTYNVSGIYTVKVYENNQKAEDVIQVELVSCKIIGELDFSSLVSMKVLRTRGNNITGYKFGSHPNFYSFDARYNPATGILDLRQFTTLVSVLLDYTHFTTVLADNLTLLTTLTEYPTQDRIGDELEYLSLSGCTSMQYVYIDNPNLYYLNITGCNSLKSLKIAKTKLGNTGLIGANTVENIQTLWLHDALMNSVPNFNLNAYQAFIEIGYEGGKITSIDLSECSSLERIGNLTYSYSPQVLESLVLPNEKTKLKKLNIANTKISGEIDVRSYINLSQFEFEKCDFITHINYSGLNANSGESSYFRGLSRLQSFKAANTPWTWNGSQGTVNVVLEEVDISGCPNLKNVYLPYSNLPTIQVNKILVDADSIGNTNGAVMLLGNAATPDATSGGYDGLTAKANLLAKGWTVQTN